MNTKNQTVKQTVLIIDDEQTNLNVMINTLKEAGLESITARNGEMGLKRAQFSSPDLILLDVLMPPGIDGLETCRRLKADAKTQDIPVIFMTALKDMQNKQEAFEAGGVDYITKPFEEQEVLMRVRTHLTLRRTQLSLEQEIATKNTFFSIIAHDLRSPFNALLGEANLIIGDFETVSKEELQKYIVENKEIVEELYVLLSNLLTWSRIQRGLMDFQPTALHLYSLIDGITSLFRIHLEKKRIAIELQIDQSIYIYGDENMINTVIRNLLSNALKFTNSGGKIFVSTHQEYANTNLEIVDTGNGIPAYIIPNIFQIDQKTSTIGTSGEQGTGLGLPLCKDLIEKNGGTIQIKSTSEKGTTFAITLPNAPENAFQFEEEFIEGVEFLG